jgi:uncharacterized cupredoxin-like copper-binding protein
MKRLHRTYFLLLGAPLLMGLLVTLVFTPAYAQTSQNVSLTLTEFKITPGDVEVPGNTPVRFTVTNGGTMEHNLVVELEDENIEQKLFATNLMPGETRTAEFTFTTAGKWEMYCPVDGHKDHGMVGDITVMGASPGMPSTGSTGMEVAVMMLAGLALALLASGMLVRWGARSRRA